MTTEQLSQTKQKYLDTLNRVNLLLLKQHDLRRDQRIYLHQLQKIQDLLFLVQTQSSPESQGGNDGINVLAEDSHLRQIIKENQREIWRLERKKGQGIWAEVNQLKNVQAKYLNMIDNQFQNGIQQKLSTIRGKVDELKKKIKEINKEILGYQQEHLEGIDQYSFCLTILKDYQNQNKELKQQIAKLKSQKK